MRKKNIRFVVILLVLAGLAIFYYIHLTNTTGKRTENTESKPKPEYDQLVEYDFNENYPKTVRDVVKLHSRYLKYAYNNDLDDKKLKQLNASMRKLYANELILNNSESVQLENLKMDIEKYREASTIILSATVEEQSQIEFSAIDSVNYAIVDVAYTIKIKTVSSELDERYILMKDEDGQWKILGWQDAPTSVNTSTSVTEE